MKKYATVFLFEIITQLQYRAEFFSHIFSTVIHLTVSFFFAVAFFEHVEQIYGFTFELFITYTLLSNIVNSLTGTRIQWDVAESIKSGGLSIFLTKPLRYNAAAFSRELAWKAVSLLFNGTMLALITIVFANTFRLEVIISRIPIFALLATLSYLLRRSMLILVGFAAFWAKDIGGISNFVSNIIGILGGSWIPLDFLPVISNILKFLPFSYITYFPVIVLISKEISIEQGLYIAILQLIWILLFSILANFMWRKGIRQYEAVGI